MGRGGGEMFITIRMIACSHLREVWEHAPPKKNNLGILDSLGVLLRISWPRYNFMYSGISLLNCGHSLGCTTRVSKLKGLPHCQLPRSFAHKLHIAAHDQRKKFNWTSALISWLPLDRCITWCKSYLIFNLQLIITQFLFMWLWNFTDISFSTTVFVSWVGHSPTPVHCGVRRNGWRWK